MLQLVQRVPDCPYTRCTNPQVHQSLLYNGPLVAFVENLHKRAVQYIDSKQYRFHKKATNHSQRAKHMMHSNEMSCIVNLLLSSKCVVMRQTKFDLCLPWNRTAAITFHYDGLL